ncbi:uncharacterized protein LOC132637367 [Lycium barbarum]|uniref:uncharacterized protein LOC132637367 n=1 Tax=Lycium barbarum TaxID=112863 RepID=UPI00293E24C2|nr:uncharacterized protein LOC132637367 [Lycium barbarum]
MAVQNFAQKAKEAAQEAQLLAKQAKEKENIAQLQWAEVNSPVNSGNTTSGSGLKSWADEVEEEREQPEKRSLIWDNFHISKISSAGFKLDYIKPGKYGESTITDIDLEDIESEIIYWKTTIVCYVLGAHPPFTVINGYIQRMWAKHGLNKVAMMKNGVVLVRFDTIEGKNEVLQGGIYHFDNKPFIVKAWDLEMEFTRAELYSVPIWIKLPGLDFKYWSSAGLSNIGSLIGKPLMADRNTEKKQGLNFARILVEVNMDAKLPDLVLFRNERGNVVEQKVIYDWKPTLCSYRDKYGHSIEECRKKNPVPKSVQQMQPAPVAAPVANPVAAPVATQPGDKQVVQVKKPQQVQQKAATCSLWITPMRGTSPSLQLKQNTGVSRNSFQALTKVDGNKGVVKNAGQSVEGHTIPPLGNG